MSFPNDAARPLAGSANAVTETARAETTPRDETAGEQLLDHLFRTHLPEVLDGANASASDPLVGLEAATEAVAQEIDQRVAAGETSGEPLGEIQAAIETLVNVALDADDPVAALEEGADSLAEALAARESAAAQYRQAAGEQARALEGAYRHARLHRVSELMDAGYGLDQAVAITNANEAEIRARAVAAGRNPMEPIYRYAVLTGYQGNASGQGMDAAVSSAPPPRRGSNVPQHSGTLETLAQLSEEAFADATRGGRWERLMRN